MPNISKGHSWNLWATASHLKVNAQDIYFKVLVRPTSVEGCGEEAGDKSSIAVPKAASASPTGDTGAGVTLQSWPRMGVRGSVFHSPSLGWLVTGGFFCQLSTFLRRVDGWGPYSSTVPSCWGTEFWNGIWESCQVLGWVLPLFLTFW